MSFIDGNVAIAIAAVIILGMIIVALQVFLRSIDKRLTNIEKIIKPSSQKVER